MARSHIGPSRGIDAASVLTLYLTLLLAIPAAMVVAALGSAGAPSTILALGALFWWVWHHVQRTRPLDVGFQPVRAAAIGWLLIVLIVYAHAMAVPLPSDEISPADNGLLKLMGLGGVLLVGNDGLATSVRFRAVARRLVIAVGLVAVLGLIQYVTKKLWVDRIHVPGLTPAITSELASRSGLARPSGTATHPIEFGVVLTTTLPLVVAFAIRAPRHRWVYLILLAAVSFAIFLSISRSAMICAGVGILVLIAAWSPRARLWALVFLGIIGTILYVTVPSVISTIISLFTGISDDPSVQSRTGSYDIAWQFISRSPFLGRGFGTFLPKYWILDNGYLGVLIEGGLLGLLGLLMLIVTSAAVARRAAKTYADPFDRELCRAVYAGLCAGAAGLAFFDTFGFPQSAGVFFLLLGLAGASRRIAQSEAPAPRRPARTAPTPT